MDSRSEWEREPELEQDRRDIWNQQYCDTCQSKVKTVTLVLREPHQHLLLCNECIKQVRDMLDVSEFARVFCYRLQHAAYRYRGEPSGPHDPRSEPERELYSVSLSSKEVVLLRLLGYEVLESDKEFENEQEM